MLILELHQTFLLAKEFKGKKEYLLIRCIISIIQWANTYLTGFRRQKFDVLEVRQKQNISLWQNTDWVEGKADLIVVVRRAKVCISVTLIDCNQIILIILHALILFPHMLSDLSVSRVFFCKYHCWCFTSFSGLHKNMENEPFKEMMVNLFYLRTVLLL